MGSSAPGGQPRISGEPKGTAHVGWNRLITLIVIGVVAAVMGALAWAAIRPSTGAVSSGGQPSSPSADGSSETVAQVVRDDSHRLSVAADGKVTFVEFSDFECEACGAVYPTIEQLRARYDGRVTFVVRYLPLDGHYNGFRAARAVEAAAQQGQFEAMYQKMFATQSQWGEWQTPADEVFRDFAAELGLDITRWDADYASAATKARVQADLNDARALGLTSTPSFFLNGQRLEPRSVQDLTDALDQALAQ